jgi:hypothetical protein
VNWTWRTLAGIAGAVALSAAMLTSAQIARSDVIATAPPVAIAAPTGVNGYTMLDANGNVYNFGTEYLGGAAAHRVAPFVAMAYTPSGRGYALLDSQGHVYNYGDSVHRGGAPAGASLPFVAIAYKPGTNGYTLMDSKGHIYNYGTDYLGGAPDLRNTYTALAYTPSGRGYILMDSVGHIYAYGDSKYRGGNPGGAATPMRGLAFKPGSDVYTELDATGHVYNYGTTYLGGGPANSARGFVGIVYTPSGNGYAMADGTGHIYNYGDSRYRGGLDGIQGTPTSGGIVGNPLSDSTGVACASGTRDVGIHEGWTAGNLVRVRLCALTNLNSSSEESVAGSPYYVAEARGNALVTSRVSGAAYAMAARARSQGVTLSAISSFRTMAHQKALCDANAACKRGDYSFVAKPGRSNHQMGAAIDFAGTNVKSTSTSCNARATDPRSTVWNWLESNARSFGFHQYARESWHWDALTGASNC